MSLLDDLLDARLSESAQTAALSRTHAPIGKGGRNWITASKPGNTGQLPAYIQNVRNAIMRGGSPESRATAIAIGRVRDWAEGKGNVGAEVRAAAAKAIAEFDAMRAKSKGKLKEELTTLERLAVVEAASERLAVLGEGALATLLEEASAPWQPTLKRVASGRSESARHEVHDAGQHVGTICERPGYMRTEPKRWRAMAINGDTVGDMHSSQADAISSLHRHLAEGPQRVQKHGQKYLVAHPDSFSGPTKFTEYPSHAAARYGAGLPEKASTPEKNAKLGAMAECFSIDAQLVREYAEPGSPHLAPLAEAFTERLHPRAHGGTHGGEFVRKLFGAHDTLGAIKPTRKDPIPEGSGPKAPGADLRSPGELAQLARETKGTNQRKLTEKELPNAVGKGPWDERVAETLKTLRSDQGSETDKLYRGGDGRYTPERIELHARIIKALLQGAGAHPNDKQAIFLAGGPASGKSTLLKSGHVKTPSDAVDINPDIIKGMLPEYRALVAAGDQRAAAAVHEESSHIAAHLTRLAMAREHHVVIDGTGNSAPGKFAGKVQRAADHGYQTSVHYATIPTEVAVKRAVDRAANPKSDSYGRVVNQGFLRTAHANVTDRFHSDVRHMKGVTVRVYDTLGKKPKLIYERANDAEKVRDAKRFKGFLSKGNDTGVQA